MTRIARALALIAALVFAFVGCAQPIKDTGAKKSPRKAVTAKKPSEPGASSSAPAKPEQPKGTKPATPIPAKPGEKAGPQPPPPPEFERPVRKDIDAAKIGIPIYPGAEIAYAQEWTWPKSKRGSQRSASLRSTDDPEKIIKWYQAKLGSKAEVHRKDLNDSRKVAWLYLSDTKARVVKSASVSWTEAKPGETTDVSIYLTYRKLGTGTGR